MQLPAWIKRLLWLQDYAQPGTLPKPTHRQNTRLAVNRFEERRVLDASAELTNGELVISGITSEDLAVEQLATSYTFEISGGATDDWSGSGFTVNPLNSSQIIVDKAAVDSIIIQDADGDSANVAFGEVDFARDVLATDLISVTVGVDGAAVGDVTQNGAVTLAGINIVADSVVLAESNTLNALAVKADIAIVNDVGVGGVTLNDVDSDSFTLNATGPINVDGNVDVTTAGSMGEATFGVTGDLDLNVGVGGFLTADTITFVSNGEVTVQGANISVNAVAFEAEDLTASIDVGADAISAGGSGLQVSQATVLSVVEAGATSVTIGASGQTGAVTINQGGGFSTKPVATQGAALTVNANGLGGSVVIQSDITTDGGFTVNGSGATTEIFNVSQTITELSGDIEFNDSLLLKDGVTLTLDTSTGNGAVTVNGNIRAEALPAGDSQETLIITAGSGVVTLGGGAGLHVIDGDGVTDGDGVENFGDLTITTTGNVNLNAGIDANSVAIAGGAAIVDIRKAVNLTGENGGNALSVTATDVELSENITTAAGAININAGTILNANVAIISTANGDITVGNVDADLATNSHLLFIDAGSGAVQTGDLGADKSLSGGVTLLGGTIQSGAITTSNSNANQDGGSIILGGAGTTSVSIDGDLNSSAITGNANAGNIVVQGEANLTHAVSSEITITASGAGTGNDGNVEFMDALTTTGESFVVDVANDVTLNGVDTNGGSIEIGMSGTPISGDLILSESYSTDGGDAKFFAGNVQIETSIVVDTTDGLAGGDIQIEAASFTAAMPATQGAAFRAAPGGFSTTAAINNLDHLFISADTVSLADTTLGDGSSAAVSGGVAGVALTVNANVLTLTGDIQTTLEANAGRVDLSNVTSILLADSDANTIQILSNVGTGGDITLAPVDSAAANSLVLNAGAANVLVGRIGDIGAGEHLDNVQITGAVVNLAGSIFAGSKVDVNGNAVIENDLQVNVNGGDPADAINFSGDIDIESGHTLTLDTSMTASDGNIVVVGNITGASDGGENLVIEAGDNNVTLGAAGGIVETIGGTGGDAAFGAITVNTSGDVNVNAAVTAQSFSQAGGSGATTFAQDLTFTGGAPGDALSVETNSITFDGNVASKTAGRNVNLIGTGGGQVTIRGNFDLDDAAGSMFTVNDQFAKVDFDTTGGNRTISTDNGAILIQSDIEMTGAGSGLVLDTVVAGTGAAVTLAKVDGPKKLTITAGPDGDVNTGDIGSAAPINGLEIVSARDVVAGTISSTLGVLVTTSDSFTAGDINSQGQAIDITATGDNGGQFSIDLAAVDAGGEDVTLTAANDIRFSGEVLSAGGAKLTIQGVDVNTAISLGHSSAAGLAVSLASVDNIGLNGDSGFGGGIFIGQNGQTGDVLLGASGGLGGISFDQDLTVNAQGGANVTVDGQVSTVKNTATGKMILIDGGAGTAVSLEEDLLTTGGDVTINGNTLTVSGVRDITTSSTSDAGQVDLSGLTVTAGGVAALDTLTINAIGDATGGGNVLLGAVNGGTPLDGLAINNDGQGETSLTGDITLAAGAAFTVDGGDIVVFEDDGLIAIEAGSVDLGDSVISGGQANASLSIDATGNVAFNTVQKDSRELLDGFFVDSGGTVSIGGTFIQVGGEVLDQETATVSISGDLVHGTGGGLSISTNGDDANINSGAIDLSNANVGDNFTSVNLTTSTANPGNPATSTTAGNIKLGTIGAGTGVASVFVQTEGAGGTGDGNLQLNGDIKTTSQFNATAASEVLLEENININGPGAVLFDTAAGTIDSGSNGAKSLTINTDGNVQIGSVGTSSALTALTVAGGQITFAGDIGVNNTTAGVLGQTRLVSTAAMIFTGNVYNSTGGFDLDANGGFQINTGSIGNAETVDFLADAGNISFKSGDITLSQETSLNIDLRGPAPGFVEVSNITGNAAGSGTVSIAAVGNVLTQQIGDDVAKTDLSDVTLTGGNVNLGGSVFTRGSATVNGTLNVNANRTIDAAAGAPAINIDDVLITGGATLTLDTTRGGDAISVAGDILGDALAGRENLVIAGGAANVTLGAGNTIGEALTPFGEISINTTGDVEVNSSVFADSLVIEGAANDVTLNQAVTLDGVSSVVGATMDALKIQAAGSVSVDEITAIAADAGNVTIAGATVNLNGDISTNDTSGNGDISITGAIELQESIIISTGGNGGDVLLTGTVNAADNLNVANETLTIVAGTGDVTVTGDIGAGGAAHDELGQFDVSSANNLSLQAVVTSGDILIGSAVSSIDGVFSPNGDLTANGGDVLIFADAVALQQSVSITSSNGVDSDVVISTPDFTAANPATTGLSVTAGTGADRGEVNLNGTNINGLDFFTIDAATVTLGKTTLGDGSNANDLGGIAGTALDVNADTLTLTGDILTTAEANTAGAVDLSEVGAIELNKTTDNVLSIIAAAANDDGFINLGPVDSAIGNVLVLNAGATEAVTLADAGATNALAGLTAEGATVSVNNVNTFNDGNAATPGMGAIELTANATGGVGITFDGNLNTTVSGMAGNIVLTATAGATALLEDDTQFTTDGVTSDANIVIDIAIDSEANAGVSEQNDFTLNAGSGDVDINSNLGTANNGELGLLTINADEISIGASVDSQGVRASGATSIDLDATGPAIINVGDVESFFQSAKIDSSGGNTSVEGGTAVLTLRGNTAADEINVGDGTETDNIITTAAVNAISEDISQLQIGHDQSQVGTNQDQTGAISFQNNATAITFQPDVVVQADAAEVNIDEDIIANGDFTINGADTVDNKLGVNVQRTLSITGGDQSNIAIRDNVSIADGEKLTLESGADAMISIDGDILGEDSDLTIKGGANSNVTIGNALVTSGVEGIGTTDARFGDIDITAGTATVESEVFASSVKVVAGVATFNDQLTLNRTLPGLSLDVQAGTVTFAAGADVTVETNGGDVSILGNGNAADSLTIASSLIQTTGADVLINDFDAGVDLSANIKTTGGLNTATVQILSDVVLQNSVEISTNNTATAGSDITLANVDSDATGDQSMLTVDAGAANITTGDLGAASAITGGVDLQGNAVNVQGGIKTANDTDASGAVTIQTTGGINNLGVQVGVNITGSVDTSNSAAAAGGDVSIVALGSNAVNITPGGVAILTSGDNADSGDVKVQSEMSSVTLEGDIDTSTTTGGKGGKVVLDAGANSQFNLGGDIITSGGPGATDASGTVDINATNPADSELVLLTDVEINTSSVGPDGAVTLHSDVEATTAAAPESLSINVGDSGLVTFRNDAGTSQKLGTLTITGNSLFNKGAGNTVITEGDQTYNGEVTIDGASADSQTTLETGAKVIFNDNVNAATNNFHKLTIEGQLQLNASIGVDKGLKSLEVTGPTSFNGAGPVTVNTLTQKYVGAATLEQNTKLTGNNVTFDSAIDGDTNGGQSLAIATAANGVIAGETTFNGSVGDNVELSSISVNDTLNINGAVIATALNQTYNHVVLQTNVTLRSGNDILINDTLNSVDGNQGLTIADSVNSGSVNNVTFDGLIGNAGADRHLANLTQVQGDGVTQFNADGNIDGDVEINTRSTRIAALTTLRTNIEDGVTTFNLDDGAVLEGNIDATSKDAAAGTVTFDVNRTTGADVDDIDFVMGPNSSLTTNNASDTAVRIIVNAAGGEGDAKLGDIQAAGGVIIDVGNGNGEITDNNAAGTNITAAKTSLISGDGIGHKNAIETVTGLLSVENQTTGSGRGGIEIDNTSMDLEIGAFNGIAGVTHIGDANGDAVVKITSTGNVNVTADVDTGAGATGGVDLTLMSGGAFTLAGGADVSARGGGDTLLDAGTTLDVSGDVTTLGGSTTFNSVDDAEVSGVVDTTGGDTTFVSGSKLTVTNQVDTAGGSTMFTSADAQVVTAKVDTNGGATQFESTGSSLTLGANTPVPADNTTAITTDGGDATFLAGGGNIQVESQIVNTSDDIVFNASGDLNFARNGDGHDVITTGAGARIFGNAGVVDEPPQQVNFSNGATLDSGTGTLGDAQIRATDPGSAITVTTVTAPSVQSDGVARIRVAINDPDLQNAEIFIDWGDRDTAGQSTILYPPITNGTGGGIGDQRLGGSNSTSGGDFDGGRVHEISYQYRRGNPDLVNPFADIPIQVIVRPDSRAIAGGGQLGIAESQVETFTGASELRTFADLDAAVTNGIILTENGQIVEFNTEVILTVPTSGLFAAIDLPDSVLQITPTRVESRQIAANSQVVASLDSGQEFLDAVQAEESTVTDEAQLFFTEVFVDGSESEPYELDISLLKDGRLEQLFKNFRNGLYKIQFKAAGAENIEVLYLLRVFDHKIVPVQVDDSASAGEAIRAQATEMARPQVEVVEIQSIEHLRALLQKVASHQVEAGDSNIEVSPATENLPEVQPPLQSDANSEEGEAENAAAKEVAVLQATIPARLRGTAAAAGSLVSLLAVTRGKDWSEEVEEAAKQHRPFSKQARLARKLRK